MIAQDDELARLLEPLRAEVAEHHRRLVGAGVNPEAIASALAGWGAKGMAEFQGPGTAARLLRTLAEAIEEGEELTPGASESGGGDSDPPGGADPQAIMAGAIRDAAARLAQQGVVPELIASLALATAAAIVAEAFDREFASARLAELAVEVVEAPKRPRGHA